jgi:hypothetical protein
MIEVLVWSVLVGAVAYRLGRFIVLDTMFEGTRDRAVDYLEARSHKMLFAKVLELVRCPYCITVWTSGAVCATVYGVSTLPFPVLVWGVSSAVALVFWRVVDPE